MSTKKKEENSGLSTPKEDGMMMAPTTVDLIKERSTAMPLTKPKTGLQLHNSDSV